MSMSSVESLQTLTTGQFRLKPTSHLHGNSKSIWMCASTTFKMQLNPHIRMIDVAWCTWYWYGATFMNLIALISDKNIRFDIPTQSIECILNGEEKKIQLNANKWNEFVKYQFLSSSPHFSKKSIENAWRTILFFSIFSQLKILFDIPQVREGLKQLNCVHKEC